MIFDDMNPGLRKESTWGGIRGTVNQIGSQNQINQIRGESPSGSTGQGIPQQVTNLGVTIGNASSGSTCTITVSFQQNPTDKNFGLCKILVKGYNGNPAPVVVALSSTSPATFVLNNTGENILIIAQASGNAGDAPIANSPTVGAKLPKNALGGAGSNSATGIAAIQAYAAANLNFVLTVAQNAHGFSVGNAVYFNGSTWAKAKADVISTLGIGIVKSVPNGNSFTVCFSGYISGLSGLTAGQYYFVSDATAGLLTTTEPTATSSFSNPLLIALSTTTGIVLPFRPSEIDPFPINVVTKTANYTAVAGDVVRCDTSAGGFTVTLPSSATLTAALTIDVKKISTDSNTLTIVCTGGDTFEEGTTSLTVTSPKTSLTFTPNGSGWDIV